MTIRDREHRIAAVRRFNRFYTRQLGVLRKTYLDSPYSLGEARVLYEIASGDAPTASDIGRALDLDAGYLSRTLRNFEKRRLIARKASAKRRPAKPSGAVAARQKGFRAAGAALAARYRGDARQAFSRRPGSADRGDEHDRNAARRRARNTISTPERKYILRAPSTGRFRLDRQTPRRALRRGVRLDRTVRRCLRANRRRFRQQQRRQARALLDCRDGRRECRLDHAGERERKRCAHPPSAGGPESARARPRRAAHRRKHPLRPARGLQENHAMDAQRAHGGAPHLSKRPASR